MRSDATGHGFPAMLGGDVALLIPSALWPETMVLDATVRPAYELR